MGFYNEKFGHSETSCKIFLFLSSHATHFYNELSQVLFSYVWLFYLRQKIYSELVIKWKYRQREEKEKCKIYNFFEDEINKNKYKNVGKLNEVE